MNLFISLLLAQLPFTKELTVLSHKLHLQISFIFQSASALESWVWTFQVSLSFPSSPDKSETTKALLPTVHFIYPGGCAFQAAPCDKCSCHLFKWQQSWGWWYFAVWQGVHKSVSSITTKSMNNILFQYKIYTWMPFPKGFWNTVVFEEFDNGEFAFYSGQNNIFLFHIHKTWDTKEQSCWLLVLEVKYCWSGMLFCLFCTLWGPE